MIIIEPKVKFTKKDVECIRNLENMCRAFDFNPWDVFEAVEDKCGLNNVYFEYEGEEDDEEREPLE